MNASAATNRCLGCGDPIHPRARDKHRGCTVDKAPAAAAPAPKAGPRPRLADSMRLPAGAAFLAGGVSAITAGAQTLLPTLDPPVTASTLGMTAAGLLCLGPVIHGCRVSSWRDREEDSRITARLLLIAGPGTRVTVQGRDEHTPVDVTVIPGPKFTPADVAQLTAAFAFAIGPIEPWQVRVERVRGAFRLTRALDQDAPDAQVFSLHAVDALDGETRELDAPAPTREAATLRVEEAMRAAVTEPGLTLAIEWLDDQPMRVVVTYPSPLIPKAEANQNVVLDTMRTLHAPEPKCDWFLRWESARDRYVLEHRPDPLADLVPLPAVDTNPDLYAGVVIGVTDTGESWRLPLLGGYHWLCAGASGAGKGSFFWSIIRALEPLIADGRVRLWVCDPKGGKEFRRARRMIHRFAVSKEECVGLLEEAVQVLRGKLGDEGHEERKIEHLTREFPLDIIVIDELASLTAYAPPAIIKAAVDALGEVQSQGRAGAMTTLGATQDPTKDTLGKIRGLFTGKVALRMSEAQETNVVLGAGARARGAVADRISEDLPGVGYVWMDGKSRLARVRLPFVDDNEIARLVERLAPRPPAAPVPVGEQLPFEITAAARALDMAPEPLTPADVGRPGTLADVVDGCRFLFDGESIPATCVGQPEEDGDDLVVTFFYDDQPTTIREQQDARDAAVLLLS